MKTPERDSKTNMPAIPKEGMERLEVMKQRLEKKEEEEASSEDSSSKESEQADPVHPHLNEIKQALDSEDLVLSPADKKIFDSLLKKGKNLESEWNNGGPDGAKLPLSQARIRRNFIKKVEDLYEKVKSSDYSPDGSSSVQEKKDVISQDERDANSDREPAQQRKKEVVNAIRYLKSQIAGVPESHLEGHTIKAFNDEIKDIREKISELPEDVGLPLLSKLEEAEETLRARGISEQELKRDKMEASFDVNEALSPFESARAEYFASLQALKDHFAGAGIVGVRGRMKAVYKALREQIDPEKGDVRIQLAAESVDEKDMDAVVRVIEARAAYTDIRADVAMGDIAKKREELEEQRLKSVEESVGGYELKKRRSAAAVRKHREAVDKKTKEVLEEWMLQYQSTHIFDTYIAKDGDLVREAVGTGWPPKLRTMVDKAVQKMNALDPRARMALAVAGYGAVGLATGGVGAGALAGITAGLGIGMGVVGGFLGSKGGGAVHEKWWGKKQTQKAEEEIREAQLSLEQAVEAKSDFLRMLEESDKKNEEAQERLFKNKKTKSIVKGVSGVAGAMLLSFGTRFAVQEAFAGGSSIEPLKTMDQISEGAKDPTVFGVPEDTGDKTPITKGAEAGDLSKDTSGSTESAESTHTSETIEPSENPKVILEGQIDSMWDAAKELQVRLGLSEELFQEAWSDSEVELADGTMVKLHELDLVHPGDGLSYNSDLGRFQFHEGSPGLEHGTDFPHSTSPSISEQSSVVEISTASTDPEVRGYDPRQVTLTPEQAEALHPDWGLEDWKAEYERGGQVPTDFPERMMLWEPTHAMEHGMISGEVQKLTHLDSALESSEMTDAPVIERADSLPEAASKPSGYKWLEGKDLSNTELADVELGSRNFETILNVTIQDRLEKIYGADLLGSEDWKVRSSQSARQFMQTDPWSLPLGSHLEKMHTYLNNLKMETGIRPGVTFAIFPSNETVLEYIERAEGKKLESAIKAAGRSL